MWGTGAPPGISISAPYIRQSYHVDGGRLRTAAADWISKFTKFTRVGSLGIAMDPTEFGGVSIMYYICSSFRGRESRCASKFPITHIAKRMSWDDWNVDREAAKHVLVSLLERQKTPRPTSRKRHF